jgi:hypothetical protein
LGGNPKFEYRNPGLEFRASDFGFGSDVSGLG